MDTLLQGDSCDGLNKILKKYRDDELHGDDKCFDVTTTLKQVQNNTSIFVQCVVLTIYI
jgi:O-phosphoseryl-tRNA(Cys) synthetase